jgi:hypothetical protein
MTKRVKNDVVFLTALPKIKEMFVEIKDAFHFGSQSECFAHMVREFHKKIKKPID